MLSGLAAMIAATIFTLLMIVGMIYYCYKVVSGTDEDFRKWLDKQKDWEPWG
jgi:hypothetical protein